MDITSPRLLKTKALLFLLLGLLAGAVILARDPHWQTLLAFAVAVWAFARCYYFAFYVLEHYADPSFRYAGLLDLVGYLLGRPGHGSPKTTNSND